MLTEVGATETEDQVYRLLVGLSSASTDEIARGCDLQPAVARSVLARLEERGLATRTAGRPRRYVAAPPSIVDHLISERQRALQRARETLTELSAEYRRHPRSDGATNVIEVVTEPQALRLRLRQLERSANHEMCGLIKPPFVAFDVEEARRDAPADPPVRYRAVYDASALTPPALAALRDTHIGHEELRAFSGVPVKLIIVDGSTALLPLGPGEDSTAAGIIVHASALLDALNALFEHVWTAATPLHLNVPEDTPPGSPLDMGQQHLLSLLLAGLTDEAIGAQLRISRRTVQRRLRALLDLAGVRTRTELVLFASRQGWV